MKQGDDNIFPVFDQLLKRSDKEKLLQQNGITIWMTGLSGSGKTTIATGLESMLHKKGIVTQVLDGDNIRTGINNNLGFSEKDRTENIRRIAEVSKLFINCGIVTINCFVSPTLEIRANAKNIIGKENFVEVFVNTPLHICEQRDIKGLYKKARTGEIKNFTGIDAPFEPPTDNFIDLKTENKKVEESVQELYTQIIERIKHN